MPVQITYTDAKNEFLRVDQLLDGMAVVTDHGRGEHDFGDKVYIINRLADAGVVGFSICGSSVLSSRSSFIEGYSFKEVNLKIEVSGI